LLISRNAREKRAWRLFKPNACARNARAATSVRCGAVSGWNERGCSLNTRRASSELLYRRSGVFREQGLSRSPHCMVQTHTLRLCHENRHCCKQPHARYSRADHTKTLEETARNRRALRFLQAIATYRRSRDRPVDYRKSETSAASGRPQGRPRALRCGAVIDRRSAYRKNDSTFIDQTLRRSMRPSAGFSYMEHHSSAVQPNNVRSAPR